MLLHISKILDPKVHFITSNFDRQCIRFTLRSGNSNVPICTVVFSVEQKHFKKHSTLIGRLSVLSLL